ncbi:hypothetical protein HU200_032224 [Digitaria exilis]|uniref:FAS1 domain-containing protein n=1 Tax=Digitaria exilis TaxID=1010633 RepID=A0A835BKJ2_9POAL|nr:hypothetical protein HU200_032224 [Digitaria exilis]CAB3487352.1 unnamed protein product [Digitaria exilis]
MELKPAVLAVLVLCLALPRTALSQSAPAPVADTPAPAPAPHHVNLTDLLSLAGPYGTFLDYLEKTDVLRTLQSMANATDVDDGHPGLTVFAPEDSAFAAVDAAALSNLTSDELRTLMLCHSAPRYLPLSSFAALAASGPVATLAGGSQCAVNVTYAAGRISVASGWTSKARLVTSVYSTRPVAVYALDAVLLPRQVFPAEPAVAEAPVPAPAPSPPVPSDSAPAGTTEHGASKSLSCRLGGAGGALVAYLSLLGFGFLMIGRTRGRRHDWLAKRYELADLEGLSRVTTLAGGMYTANVTCDEGDVHVRSRWGDAKVVGSVSVDAPMAIYELDRVLLPGTLFHDQPPVSAIPDVPPAPAPPSNEVAAEAPAAEPEPVAPRQDDSPGGVDAPVSACGGSGDRCASYPATAAFIGTMALVELWRRVGWCFSLLRQEQKWAVPFTCD